MAELSAGRVVALAAMASALVGGAVAGGVTAASSGNAESTASASGGGSVTTARVVRTTLTNTVQVGGSIGYGGSYTVAVPAGTSAQQLLQAQQAVAEDRQQLSADKQAESGTSAADQQTISGDRSNVNTDRSTLRSDRTKKARACGGKKASRAGCTQDAQTVSQDQTQLTQATQQLDSARATAALDRQQNASKVTADETKLQGDQAALTSQQAAAVNPGTTYTALPNAGQIIRQDQALYSVSNVPVPLLYGSVAAYRAFRIGMSNGADVGELTRDLIALGYGAGLTQTDHYSAATATAVRRWQQARGLPATGELLLGDVVFEPGPIRVTSVIPAVGTSVGGAGTGSGGGGGGGTVLTATGTTPVITVDLDVTQEYLVKPGDRVSIVLPNGTSTTDGRIQTVGTVASCASGGSVGGGTGASSSGGSAGQSACSTGGGGGSSSPTVPVTITVQHTAPGASLDQAPVNVNITTQSADHVLAVPVNALLALQGGGFGVDVVDGSTPRLVRVSTGLYSNSLVQVSGSGITVGTRVEVPSL